MLPFSQCANPWLNLALFPDRTAAPCCYISGGPWPRKFGYNESIGDIWLSPEFEQLRREVVADAPNGKTECTSCNYRVNPVPDVMDDAKRHLTGLCAAGASAREENLSVAIEEFKSRNINISAIPATYLLLFGYDCNMRCIMCNRDLMHNSLGQELNADWLIANAEYLRKSAKIIISGGEPFIIPNAVRFMDWLFDDPEMADTHIAIQTNAFAIKKIIPRMKNRPVTLCVSLDSYGKHYDRVRLGSSWNRVAENIDMFLDASGDRQAGVGVSNVSVMCTLTKTGLPGLFDLTRWVVDRGLQIGYKNADYREGIDLRGESFGITPGLVRECEGWRDIMLRSIEYIEKHSRYPKDALRLKAILSRLEKTQEIEENLQRRAKDVPEDALVWEFAGGEESPWEYYSYAKDKLIGKPVLEPFCGSYRYRYVTANDHANTPYFSIPPTNKQWRDFALDIYFPPDADDPCQWRLKVQNRAYKDLADLMVPASPIGGRERMVRLPFSIATPDNDIRLSFCPVSGSEGSCLLPSWIRLKSLEGIA